MISNKEYNDKLSVFLSAAMIPRINFKYDDLEHMVANVTRDALAVMDEYLKLRKDDE